jgi:hypothetical protein
MGHGACVVEAADGVEVKADTWARAKALFEQAIELPPSERRAWLERAGADADIEALVQTLIESSETLDGFLESSPLVEPEDIAAAAAVDADADADEGWLQAGTRIGKYEIVRRIGEGGMGVVYLARDNLRRDVALKALPPATAADPKSRERLEREATAAAKISHPGVATVYGFENIDGQLFIASEYVGGGSLRQVIAAGPLSPERAVALSIEIADALHAAHGARVVHRDLKPDNVMLTTSGAVKVVDFGIAHIASHDLIASRVLTGLTQQGDVMGTLAYMAPEQLAGGTVDGRTDVYSLGLVLAEMLTGSHPLRERAAPLPRRIAPIVTRCLQLDPTARFQSAAALRDALAAVQGGIAAAAREGWWWRFHQAATIVAYALLLIPAWLARRLVSGPTISGLAGSWLFALVLVAGIAAITLRLHLLFVSRAGARAVEGQHNDSGRWLRAADLTFAAGLIVSGLFVENRQAALAVLLIAAGAAAAVAALFIEPATSRAAFDEEAATKGSLSR